MSASEQRRLEAEADAYQAQADAERESQPFREIDRLNAELAALRGENERLREAIRTHCADRVQEGYEMPTVLTAALAQPAEGEGSDHA